MSQGVSSNSSSLVGNSSTELSSIPTSQISVGIDEGPIESKTFTAFRLWCIEPLTVELLERDAVEHVSPVEWTTEADAIGQRKRVSLGFNSGPAENP